MRYLGWEWDFDKASVSLINGSLRHDFDIISRMFLRKRDLKVKFNGWVLDDRPLIVSGIMSKDSCTYGKIIAIGCLKSIFNQFWRNRIPPIRACQFNFAWLRKAQISQDDLGSIESNRWAWYTWRAARCFIKRIRILIQHFLRFLIEFLGPYGNGYSNFSIDQIIKM